MTEKDKEIQELKRELEITKKGFKSAVDLVNASICCEKCPCYELCIKDHSSDCTERITNWCLK